MIRNLKGRIPRRLAVAAAVGLGVLAAASPVVAADRAYELVTPPGSDVEVRPGGGAVAPDGNYACFNGEYAAAGATPNGDVTADDGYCARRGSDGWHTEWVTGPGVTEPQGTNGAQIYFVASDGSRVAFASDLGIFPDFPGPGTGTGSYGTRSAFMWEGGQTRWLAPTPAPVKEERPPGSPGQPGQLTQREPLAVSEDLRHGIFNSSINLVPQDTNDTLDLYEWTPDGIRVVSRDDAGNAVGGWAGMANHRTQAQASPGTVSRDGGRIFFESRATGLAGAPGSVMSVFLREGDDLTIVSPRLGPGPAADVSFVGATADGSIAYLSTPEPLTGEAKNPGPALYRYDVAADDLSLLATGPVSGGGVFFLGASDDGSTVVYRTGASPAQLVIRHEGIDNLLGGLVASDVSDTVDAVGNSRSDKRALRISARGEAVVFASSASFDGSPGGTRQVYRWTPEGGVEWLSPNPDGSPATGPASIGNYSLQGINPTEPGGRLAFTTNAVRNRPNDGRVISADGRRVFFETARRLAPGDVNSVFDVYEWRDGMVSLVTPGTQTEDALYHDSSADGATVFFTTRERLIPQLDRNTGNDLYAAREGGGFPLPPPATPCSGDACQPDLSPPGPTPAPVTGSFHGEGDVRPARRARYTVARISRAQRLTLARRGRTVLRVRATRRGAIRATASARIGRRDVVVARAVRTVPGGATAKLPLRLSKRARTVLENRGRLRLVFKVRYSESKAIARRVVVLDA